MKIRTIRLTNKYKRFHDLTIDLGEHPKKIIALVGPNGSGKSSVFDGMLYLQSAYERIGSFDRRDRSYHSMERAEIPHTAISIHFDTGDDFHTARQKKEVEGKQNTIFNFRNSYRYHSVLNITEIKALQSITSNKIGASTAIDLDEKIIDNYQRLYIYLNKLMKEEDLKPSEAKRRVLDEINTALSNTLELEINDLGDIQDQKGTLFFKKTNQQTQFPFTVLSSGEKEVVDLLLDIYLRRNDYNDTVYIIDEPELHLSTAIQKKLLIEIEKFIPDNCQLWVATHSIGFLRGLQNELKEKSEVIDFSGDLSQEPKTLVPMKKTRVNWLRVFKTALEDLTGLIAPSTIIYCEGKHEPGRQGQEQGVDADVYNLIFGETHPEALFVSSGGHNNPDKYAAVALLVLGKAFQGVTMRILKDKDINFDGTPTTDAQRTIYLAADPMRRMLNKKEIENYLFDYEIICRAYPLLQKAVYDSIIPDINASNVKEQAGAILNALRIYNGLSADDLKRKLAEFVSPETTIYQQLHSVIFE